ncbi:hypothetical protein GMA3_53 [Gordonia phage GMA3]|uniref:Uncharacterized protein n=1 Tax=Gordonia phage GMA3 TaxID=1647284 RepID=A0A0K0NKK0_9CAUD|nr:DNA polymerase processivity factor [Gordonia phage GMA3]AKL88230.1 hypothetical protein GMA3_53 [Gordonia phage GMA3]
MKAIIETSTIADAMVKAARVSPKNYSSGEMFTNGILVEVDENSKNIFVSATDLEIFYRQRMTGMNISGTGSWRISSLATKFIDKLPKGRGSVVELNDERVPGSLSVVREHKRGETFAAVPLIVGSQFPEWEPYDELGGVAVNSLSTKIESVSWAASKDDALPELQGVFMDGYTVMATNRYVAARVPLMIEPLVDNHITIPHNALTGVIHHAGDALVVKTKRGLGITPDEFTQVEVVRFADNPCEALDKRLPGVNDFDSSITVNTDDYRNACEQIFTILKKDEKGQVKLLASKSALNFTIQSESENQCQEAIPATAGPDIPTVITLNAMYVRDAIANATGQSAKIFFDQGVQDSKKFLYIQGGAGYEAWIAPQVSI